MPTLAEVADQYAEEARNTKLRTPAKRQARDMAKFFRRVLANRAGADPDRHTLTMACDPRASVAWARRHEYRAIISPGGVGTGAGLMLQRGDEPPLIAQVGDTLIWDGERVTVQE